MSRETRFVELERQLSTLTILQSVYCMEGEFAVPDETAQLLDAYSNGRELELLQEGHSSSLLQATLTIPLEDAASRMIGLHISWTACKDSSEQSDKPDRLQLRLVRPDWLLKKGFEELSVAFNDRLASIPQEDEDEDEVGLVASAVEAARWLSLQAAAASCKVVENEGALNGTASDALVRIWMHLPSLSTKSKRNDLVTYAPSYSITGIVHAGKPGLLILEAPSASDIEAYLSHIKTYSWADIPSSHKKISERLREEGLSLQDRAFNNMSEITEEINVNGMKGVRSNRGDLGALRDWLTAKGLGGDRLANVLGTNLNGV